MRVVGVEPTRLAAQEPKSCASANSTIPAYSSILQLRPNRLNIVSVPAAKVNHCIDISALHSAYYRRTIVSFSMAERGFLPMRRSKLRRAGSIAATYLLVAALAVLGWLWHSLPAEILLEPGQTLTLPRFAYVQPLRTPIVLYDYQPSRKGSCVQEFLEGFHGMVQCDGYQGYNRLEDVILVCCLAHARRKFFEAVPAARRKKLKLLDVNSDEAIEDTGIPDEEKLEQLLPAEIGLLYCNKLFYLERTLKELEAEERKQQRTILEQPVWEQFWNWLGTLHPTGGSKLGKAVNYAQNHHDTLMNYMIDGRCEISNNRAERKAKSYAVGRKAFLFHTSEAGAGASAVMYSIVETAKANNLNIFQYLYMVLLYMPDYMNSSAGIEQLMPWSEFIKEQCSGIIDVESNVPENRIPLPCR